MKCCRYRDHTGFRVFLGAEASGSFSRSAVCSSSGGVSQLSGLVAGGPPAAKHVGIVRSIPSFCKNISFSFI